MAIKPILFKTEMVRAILDGRKSCTRKVVKPQPTARYGVQCIKPPYQPGDILYVRETWKRALNGYYYYEDWQRDDIADITKWKPSIHMPKEAARIWLNVTNVRVERLQQITEVGIREEGIEVNPNECAGKFDFISELFLLFQKLWDSTIKKSDLTRYGWDANPWVWVIEFERCEKPEGV